MTKPAEFPHMVRLLSMRKPEAQKLSGQVADSDTYLTGYMHAHYPDRRRFLANNPVFLRYRRRRDREIRTILGEDKPVLIFEESRHVRELPARIGKLPASATLYVVSTESGGPDPLRNSWNRVGKVLQEANVQSILLGGGDLSLVDIETVSPQLLMRYAKNLSGSPETLRRVHSGSYHILPGCGGIAAEELAQRDFLVAYNRASFSFGGIPKPYESSGSHVFFPK
jgi:hypothetical protein